MYMHNRRLTEQTGDSLFTVGEVSDSNVDATVNINRAGQPVSVCYDTSRFTQELL